MLLRFLALHWVAYKGHLTIVKQLVDNEKNIEGNGNGCTALHLAAFQGHTDIVGFLISNGYDVNEKIKGNDFEEILSDEDETCDTAIDIYDFNDALQLQPILKLESGETALHLSSLGEHKDTVRLLLKNEADINIKDDTDKTPLQIIIETGMTDILIKEKVPVNLADYDDCSPLQLSAQQGDLSFVKYCGEIGCDTNARSKISDLSALDLAVINGHTEVVKYLIKCKANVNDKSRDIIIGLKFAVQENRKDIMSILLNEKPEISAEKEREYFLLAISCGHEEIVELILNTNSEDGVSRLLCHEFPLHTAVSLGHLNIVKMLLEVENREHINYKIENFAIPLQIASGQGYCEIARLLLSKDADPNTPDKFLPLNVAVINGDSEMVEILIEYKANITLRDSDGYSAIEMAVVCKNLDIMERLLELSSIDINFKGPDDRTLLHHAADSGSLQNSHKFNRQITFYLQQRFYWFQTYTYSSKERSPGYRGVLSKKRTRY
ncbi:unnamed protein product [Larinioides sclopetarius]|uniref:Uncharacterized protein n=1 Tax=Larinioides sclopetarius TaxID=280406 RepID=A0AAV2AFP5_9ARAC